MQAGALPLLEYFLDRLWQARTANGLLTFTAYEALGGVENTLARRAEEAFQALPDDSKGAFPAVLRALATVPLGIRRELPPVPRLWRPLPKARQAGVLVDAFLKPDERLLVIDRDQRIRVAHEALLHALDSGRASNSAPIAVILRPGRCSSRTRTGGPPQRQQKRTRCCCRLASDSLRHRTRWSADRTISTSKVID